MCDRKADISWMRGSYGVGGHWIPGTVFPLEGKPLPFEEAVKAFDVDRYVDQLVAVGAQHTLFVSACPYQRMPMPHPILDMLLPGRTSKRDLFGELCERLAKEKIRLIVYYNHSCNCEDDAEWKKACGYHDGNLDLFAAHIATVIEYISRRYGEMISGWWFDSSYSVDPSGPTNTITRALNGWQYPWPAINAAAKAGNPNAAVSFNAGWKTRYLYSRHQDYYAGECIELTDPEDGLELQDHVFIPIDGESHHDWGYSGGGWKPTVYSDEDLKTFLDKRLSHGDAVTFNVQIEQSGLINPAALAQLKRIRGLS